MGRLEGKVAIVTGGASGIGAATLTRFAAEGARVVCADVNDEAGERLAKEIAARGGVAAHRHCDVGELAQVEAVVEFARREHGGLDVMFNNAARSAGGYIHTLDPAQWDASLRVMLTAVFYGIRAAVPAMLERGGGSIINTASVAGLSGGAGPLCYSAAKAAVVNLTRAAALELAPDKIRVNAICPGGILTPLIHRGSPDAARPRLQQLQPWPEVGEGQHIAGAALFLSSDDARFVTGEALVVDGGLTAAGPNLISRMRDPNTPSVFNMGVTGVDKGTTGQPPVIRSAK